MNTTYTKLYQLQSRVCQSISLTKTDFYLTGGTALARCYLHHRVSIDLDFFLNQADDFLKQTEMVITHLQKSFHLQTQVKTSDFVSLLIENELKLDFVNDVAHHWGDFKSSDLYERIDNPLNILANKLTAIIARDEPKDAVDIIALATKETIDWPLVFTHANSKAAGILPPLVCQKLESMPLELLDSILWESDWKEFADNFEHRRLSVIAQMLKIRLVTEMK